MMSADNWKNCPKCGADIELLDVYSENEAVYIEYSYICKNCGFVFKVGEKPNTLKEE